MPMKDGFRRLTTQQYHDKLPAAHADQPNQFSVVVEVQEDRSNMSGPMALFSMLLA